MSNANGKVINSFKGEFAFLSNFHPAGVFFGGHGYPTVEHAYQAAKADNETYRRKIRHCQFPADAKALGKRAVLDPDWNTRRIDVMKNLIQQKFAPSSDLAKQLLATNNALLVEGNNWGDTLWGVCRGVGKNNLGKLLMDQRTFLKKQRVSR